MKLDAADLVELRPLIGEVVRSVLEQTEATLSDKRLAYSEREAAALLGVRQHVLRDARLRGLIRARLLGKKYLYSRSALITFFREVD